MSEIAALGKLSYKTVSFGRLYLLSSYGRISLTPSWTIFLNCVSKDSCRFGLYEWKHSHFCYRELGGIGGVQRISHVNFDSDYSLYYWQSHSSWRLLAGRRCFLYRLSCKAYRDSVLQERMGKLNLFGNHRPVAGLRFHACSCYRSVLWYSQLFATRTTSLHTLECTYFATWGRKNQHIILFTVSPWKRLMYDYRRVMLA